MDGEEDRGKGGERERDGRWETERQGEREKYDWGKTFINKVTSRER